MAINWKRLGVEARSEFEAILSESLNGSRQPNVEAVERALDAVNAADRAGRIWPEEIRNQAMRSFLRNELKRVAKSENTVGVSWNNTIVHKTARRGVLVEQPDGSFQQQQMLWQDMTWEQFEAWSTMNDTQIVGLEINRAAAEKIRTLHQRFPESQTVGEALASQGMTLDEFLAAESA